MTRSTGIASILVLCLSLSACSLRGSQRDAAAREPVKTRVSVTNHNWSDMRIYVVRAGNRFRLGTVSSMRTQVFSLPSNLSQTSGGVQLLADPIGSRERHVTPMLNINPGQLVNFKIENHLAISSVSIW